MNTPDLTDARWRKSSYSDGGDNNCVEVADGFSDAVSVRDSKTRSDVLMVPAPSWVAFVASLKQR
ncbi:DUF397 domain-containing protein [Streptomyces profundus]|uniref:DUF397 domain-containing protein n=1 Tax=Streptomyces profundus TaxID=2867410 RepID=UPI001D16E2C4|nr:DUF397 domain-containing protein [Streptomyces sp. MA3_2.13]UED87180.1 DUF397 domain-containing protein [Streptomyces sp. MA3_2.13]